jgi:RimJ/RimL family protein N-acetyltransferase
MTHKLASTDVTLPTGARVTVRMAERDDVACLLRFLCSVPEESLTYRFLRLPSIDTWRVRGMIGAPGDMPISLIAECDGRIIGFAGLRPEPDRRDRAEVAFALGRPLEGHGVGAALFERLALAAHGAGFDVLDAYMAPDNRRTLEVLEASGLPMATRVHCGVRQVVVSLAGAPVVAETALYQDRTAVVA